MKNVKKFEEYEHLNEYKNEVIYGDEGENIMRQSNLKKKEEQDFDNDDLCIDVLKRYNEMNKEVNDEPAYDDDGNNIMASYVKRKRDKIKSWCDIFHKLKSDISIDDMVYIVSEYEPPTKTK